MAIKAFKDWQIQWVKNVQKNFAKQRVKGIFRDVYLHTLLSKKRRQTETAIKNQVICALLDEVRHEQGKHQMFVEQFKVHLKKKCVRALNKHRKREQDLEKKAQKMASRVKHWQLVKAMQNWRLYTSKLIEFKKDPITLRFLKYEGAVID